MLDFCFILILANGNVTLIDLRSHGTKVIMCFIPVISQQITKEKKKKWKHCFCLFFSVVARQKLYAAM